MPILLRSSLALLAWLCCATAQPARAAETWHTCAGYIDSLPATVASQGVWCVRANLATAIATGNAITVATNNVTIDCNGFVLDGSAAGTGTQAAGIVSSGRQNTTVRNCRVRGFFNGIHVEGAGHVVEDNGLRGSRLIGILALGENNVVRRNQVDATGGGTPALLPITAIFASADIIDNSIRGVYGNGAGADAYGLYAVGAGAEVRGNSIYSGTVDGGTFHGLVASAGSMRVVDNQVDARNASTGTGIDASGASTACSGNSVVRFATAYAGCESSGADNVSLP